MHVPCTLTANSDFLGLFSSYRNNNSPARQSPCFKVDFNEMHPLAASIFIQSQCFKVDVNEMQALAASLRVGFAITGKEPLNMSIDGLINGKHL